MTSEQQNNCSWIVFCDKHGFHKCDLEDFLFNNWCPGCCKTLGNDTEEEFVK